MNGEGAPVPRPTLGYQPALDGVRALAVAMVLGFHLDIGWLSGGYLGVSVFFTLSGFLITSLLLGEHRRTGMVDLPAFYQRRARRLVPAGLLVLALVCVLVAVDLLQARSTFRRDVLASMFQCLNWVQLFGHQSYADLFTAPSPVTHFWSLGVEEQFYVVWPLMLVVLLRVLHRRAVPERLLRTLMVLWVLTAVSAPLTARWWSHDAAYYATWARASEVMAGAVLAAFLVGRRVPRWWAWLAPVSLVVMALAVTLTPAGRGWVFEGGLPLFGIVSALLIAGLQAPGLTLRALSTRPLVWIGKLSYGIYLFHWPVFLVLDRARTNLDGLSLIALRLAVTLAAASISYSIIEHPIRLRRLLPSGRTLTTALAGAVAIVAVLAVSVEVPLAQRPDRVPTVLSVATTLPVVGPGDSGAVLAPPTPTTVMALFGDSVPAWLVRDGAASFHRTDVVLVNGAREACDAMIHTPVSRDRVGAELRPPPDCEEWDTWYPKVLDRIAAGAGHTPEIAVLVLGQAPVLDHLVNGNWVHPCDDLSWYLDDVARRVDYLRGRGLQVVFALPARLGSRSQFMVPDDYARRMGCIRTALIDFVDQEHLPSIDLDRVLCPANDCEALRTHDGVHVDPARAGDVLQWLVNQVLRLRLT